MAKSLTTAAKKKQRSELADQEVNKSTDQQVRIKKDQDRQTYYIPDELHKRLKMVALQRDVNVSDLAVEAIEYIVEKYGG
jgi:hypothetical protein